MWVSTSNRAQLLAQLTMLSLCWWLTFMLTFRTEHSPSCTCCVTDPPPDLVLGGNLQPYLGVGGWQEHDNRCSKHWPRGVLKPPKEQRRPEKWIWGKEVLSNW